MTNTTPAYSNAETLRRLGRAVESLAQGSVIIRPRECPDLARFIHRLQQAQAATRRHATHLG